MQNKTEVKVRVGTLEDLDGVMSLAMLACAENGFVGADPGKLLAEIYPSLMQNHGICGVIGPVGGKLEGVILLRVGTVWYSGDESLEEKAIFIHPDYRNANGGRASKFCEFSKHAARLLGMKLTIGVLSSTRTRGKIKMYERHFGEPLGAYWIYDGTTGQPSTTGAV